MMTEADIADDGASPLSVLARIRAQRNSPLANQRLPAAVLAALDDSLRESGEAPTPGAYWAGLVGVLQRVLGGGAGAQDETLGAVVYLLAAVFPRWDRSSDVPRPP